VRRKMGLKYVIPDGRQPAPSQAREGLWPARSVEPLPVNIVRKVTRRAGSNHRHRRSVGGNPRSGPGAPRRLVGWSLANQTSCAPGRFWIPGSHSSQGFPSVVLWVPCFRGETLLVRDLRMPGRRRRPLARQAHVSGRLGGGPAIVPPPRPQHQRLASITRSR
jgi:hypothetical protein